MKTNTSPRVVAKPGVTLVELTIIIAIMLTLTVVLFIGARAWIRGSDRAACVMTIQNVQKCVRSYQNLYGYNPGSMPYADHGTQSIADHLYQKGYIDEGMHASIKGSEDCPGGGHYEISNEEVFPPIGQLYVGCSLSGTQRHLLERRADW